MRPLLSKSVFNMLVISILTFSQPGLSASGFDAANPDNSIVRLEDSFGSCTGTRTSNSGHILTARHCFNACLISGEFVEAEKLYPEFGWQSPKLFRFPNNKKAICSVKIDGVDQDVEIIAASAGFMTPREQSSFAIFDKEKYLEFLNKGYLHNGDYAIIKPLQDTKNHLCRKIRKSQETSRVLREAVHYIGYPGKTTGRAPGRNSDGESLLLSRGFIIESILENSCLERSLNKKGIEVKYDRPEILLSTVDDVPGASGAALLDKKGEIIGIINSVYKDRIDVFSEYCSGSTVSLSIQHIVSEMKKNTSDAEIDKTFDCKKP